MNQENKPQRKKPNRRRNLTFNLRATKEEKELVKKVSEKMNLSITDALLKLCREYEERAL